MRTNVAAFIIASENRERIVRTLLEYPDREWSCPSVEDATKLPHATVFRTLTGLKRFGMLKTSKINRKNIVYEVAESPLKQEFERMLNIEQIAAKSIAQSFVDKAASREVYSIILFGSSVKGDMRPESDIDILIVLNKHDRELEIKIQDIAAQISSDANKTISTVIMDKKEVQKEINTPFIKSILENMELLYGKNPF
ncbi:nucleotidyltransferase domain-containing protein [Candidatus Woesearchaeota archaeon]|nr:nucleotidyltransferase domain-containing protein [Candidatus Woesearchaeota archaeon]